MKEKKKKLPKKNERARIETPSMEPASVMGGVEPVTVESIGESVLPAVAVDPVQTATPETPSLQPAAAVIDGTPAMEPSMTKAKTLVLPLDENDNIVWSEIKREATRERVRRAMGTAETTGRKALELEGLAKIAPALWMGIGAVSSWAITRKLPESVRSQVAELMAYTDDELSELAGPTAAVIQKWTPAGLAEWDQELMLVMIASRIHMQKWAMVQVELQKLSAIAVESEAK